jgi:DNA-directed RNA polymerase subunit E'/Rpb7/predicted NAD-dependent protein-ADP-ribosyltransferase YbiA (DUF1768 family)
MDQLFFKNVCQTRVSITPSEINNSINENIKKRIKHVVEGKCIREGYVRPGSVEIINKSMGSMMMAQFNGNVLYNVRYSCDVCDPKEGMIIEAKVVNVNKMGIVAYGAGEALNILVAKQHHIDDDNFSKIKENDTITISVIGVRKELESNQISIIGKLVYNVKKSAAPSPVVSREASPEPSPFTPEKESEPEASPEPEPEPEAPVEEPPLKFTNKSKANKFMTMHNNDNELIYKGTLYKTIEHAFQAQKSNAPEYKELFDPKSQKYIGDDGTLAKKTGTKKNIKDLKFKLVKDFDSKSNEILEDITREYFKQNEQLKKKLKNTGTRVLEYVGNKDFSEILMKLRSEF